MSDSNTVSVAMNLDMHRCRSIISEAFSDVLEIHSVKEDGLYVDLGGNSLNITSVLLKIEKLSGILMDPDLFFHPTNSTVVGLAESLFQNGRK